MRDDYRDPKYAVPPPRTTGSTISFTVGALTVALLLLWWFMSADMEPRATTQAPVTDARRESPLEGCESLADTETYVVYVCPKDTRG